MAADFTDKNSRLVAFHAKRSSPLTTTAATILICDDVVSNTGDPSDSSSSSSSSYDYDRQSGVFTAPVTGTYCFLATSSPNEPDDDVVAAADLVVDGRVVGGLCSYGYRWATGHCALRLTAGQRVWLRTMEGRHSFAGGWWTTFSGMLLQPEL